MDGWIKLHREIIDHWIYKDAEYLKVWIEMLVRARYWNETGTELVGDQLIKVDRGEFIFGRPKWSQRLGISEQRLKTLVQKMIKDDMIELIQKYPRFTLYRIKNYEKFNQHDNQQSNQQETPQPQGVSGDGNQHDNQQGNQRATSSQPAANQQPTNNKESKERSKKDKKKEYTSEFESFWNIYPRKIGKAEAFKTWNTVLKKGEEPQTIIRCAENYKAQCDRLNTEQQYIKHPKTFLNEERYKDYLQGGEVNAGSAGISKYQGTAQSGYGGSNRKITSIDQTSRVRELSEEELAGLI